MPDHAFQVSTPTVALRTSAEAGSTPTGGLPRCEALGPIVDRQLAACRRNGTPLAVIAIRLEGLESIEPQYRHAIENQLLYAAWNRLRGHLRATDLCGAHRPRRVRRHPSRCGGAAARDRPGEVIDSLSQLYGIGALEVVISARAGAAVYPQAGTTGEAVASAARQLRDLATSPLPVSSGEIACGPIQRPAVTAVRPSREVNTSQRLPYFVGISGESVGPLGLSMHLVLIPPGARSEPHLHLGHETAIYVLQGRVETLYGPDLTQSVISRAGDFLFIPPDVPHVAINLSAAEPARAMVVAQRPGRAGQGQPCRVPSR